ncbi:chaperonin 10-like protein [Lentinula guzmanii]|uniref:Chaperonin 10-like protein n=1 Tax=Lentinula guzmanii TaxID=2804957 RepID=A0AA38J4K0_9AGAR|nr:chaperonin 10-like protein [Lentinula guzmanii]KAJ3796300.1 chaperonin 10-like protein [Lentinula aff. detonsa]
MSQKALVLEKPKSPFVLSSIPIPKPGAGEVQVKVLACGLNPVDTAVQARDIIPNVKYPTILGLDVAGDVEEVGEGVEEYVKGDRVFFSADYSMAHGGLQQYTLKSVSDPDIGKIPPHISYNEAATIPLTFATAVIPLLSVNPIGAGLNPTFDSKVNFDGEAALVIGGGTSVGQFAIQIYKYLGFSTIITYASLKHSDYLKSLGATHVIDRTQVSISTLFDSVKTITSLPIKNVYVASIMVEGAMEAGYACLAHGGQMATASPAPPKPDDAEATGRKIYGVFASVNIEPNKEFGKELWKNLPRLVKEGIIKPNRIEMLTGLTAVPDALPRFMNGGVSGVKLIVNPQDTV